METWRNIWLHAAAQLSTTGLRALLEALETDSPQLIQGATTTPPPLACVWTRPVEGACLLGYCGWKGNNLKTVGEVEMFFEQVCLAIDKEIGEPDPCRWLLKWYDETPREEMRRVLLQEVKAVLAERG